MVGASFGGMTPTPARDQAQDLHPPCPGGQGIPLAASGEDLGGSAPTSPEHTALRQSGNAAWTLQQLKLSFFQSMRPLDSNLYGSQRGRKRL